MKKIILIAALLPLFGFGQSITGTVKDSTSGETLSLANLTFLKGYSGTNTNWEGQYVLNLKGHAGDSVKISYVGYRSQYLALQQFTENKPYTLHFSLVRDDNPLQEVILSQKKIKYNKKYYLSEERKGDVAMFSLIGHETACLVENPKNEMGRIKSIKLYIRKNKAADFIAKFRITLYAFDKKARHPGESLLTEDLIISPKNRTYQYVVEVEDKKIPFPEDGVCVGIELVDENNSAKKGAKIGPGFRFTYGESQSLTWHNYRNQGWAKNNGYNRKSHDISNLMVGMTILMKE